MLGPLRRLRTLGAKVTWVIGLASGVAVLLVSLLTGIRSYRHLEQQGIDTVRSQARVVASNSSAAFAFGDREAATQMLAALRTVEGLQRAYLIDRAGKVFAHWM